MNPENADLLEHWLKALVNCDPGSQDAKSPPTPPDDPIQWAVDHGISDEDQMRAFAELTDLELVQDLAALQPAAAFVEAVPIGFARRHALMGFRDPQGADLHVAICSLSSWPKLDVLARFLGAPVQPLVAPRSEILRAINAAYERREGQAQAVIDSLQDDEALGAVQQIAAGADLLDVSDRAPVIKLVNMILFEAVRNLASDIHFQPFQDRLVIRMRIDGVLFNAFRIRKSLHEEVATRIKIIGKMDIAEKRLPQDGRSTVRVGDREIDLRIASIPSQHGERVVIRLLDKSARIYTLGELGMPLATLHTFRELIAAEHGLILVTGPTGSGKSTTLYAALQEINTKDRNVVTLEDPIEYQLEGISQTQISDRKGLTFASGLRHVLRQDPDIIMVGEIRDHETAVMAIQSALTGHLVFSTLHTNDAASAVTRLLDLGIEPYLVASSLIAAMAQRLVRTVCQSCAREIPLRPADLQRLALDATDSLTSVRVGGGCAVCRETGYRGRIGIFELLVVDEAVRELVQGRANASQIRTAAVKTGMRLLRQDGCEKISSGRTTVDEVLRVTMRTAI